MFSSRWDVFREAKRIYTRMGFAERVDLVEADAKHGFSQPLRVAMVRWMRRWLLEIDEPITEPEIETHSADDLLCTPQGQVLLMDGARSVADLNVEFDKQLEKQRIECWCGQSHCPNYLPIHRVVLASGGVCATDAG